MNAADFVADQTIDERDLEAYREAANPGHHVKSIIRYHEAVNARLAGKGPQGDTLPWPRTHPDFRLRPGEVTLWHGINGHGKSAITTQVALWLALQGKPSCIASFEMAPVITVTRMVGQAAGSATPSTDFTMKFFLALAPLVWIYERPGRVALPMLYAAMRYCAAQKRTTHFFIDSLMKCVRGSDDYNGQKDFVHDLCELAKETQQHVHLVHHVKKLSDESEIPGKFDAKGAGEISDQVDNVLGVWRNKRKEQERAKCLHEGTVFDDTGPDFLLVCDKQRNGAWEGRVALWGDVSCWHFRGTHQQGYMRGYDIPDRPARQPGDDDA